MSLLHERDEIFNEPLLIFLSVQVSFVVVNNAAIEESAYWALADALLTLLSDAHVQVLTVVAALHLPYAKPSTTAAISKVYHSVLNVDNTDASDINNDDEEDAITSMPLLSTNGAPFQPVDSAWELKDRFFASLVHLLKVEQSPRAHFLLAKGYKPGRDHAGTYEVCAYENVSTMRRRPLPSVKLTLVHVFCVFNRRWTRSRRPSRRSPTAA